MRGTIVSVQCIDEIQVRNQKNSIPWLLNVTLHKLVNAPEPQASHVLPDVSSSKYGQYYWFWDKCFTFLGFLMTALNMDNHCPWILCINPLLHPDMCIYYFPVKTHPCCSHSPSCHLPHFLLLLYICVLNLSFKIWLKSQLETTGIYLYESVDI